MLLERTVCPDNIVYYRSPRLSAAGVPHAFSTRLGGLSAAPFDSMNLGNPNGCDIQDPYDNVWANYTRLQSAIDCAGRTLIRVHQVHGNRVIVADTTNTTPWDPDQKADAIATQSPNLMLSVRIADCVPILLASADGKRVAAVHAGWRGVVANIVTEAINHLGPGPHLAAIGPCISMKAFEVGPEVLDEFVRAFGNMAPLRRRPDGKGHVDLRSAVMFQLQSAGVAADDIDTNDLCTVERSQEFFSHRRDNGITGRLAALIGTKA